MKLQETKTLTLTQRRKWQNDIFFLSRLCSFFFAAISGYAGISDTPSGQKVPVEFLPRLAESFFRVLNRWVSLISGVEMLFPPCDESWYRGWWRWIPCRWCSGIFWMIPCRDFPLNWQEVDFLNRIISRIRIVIVLCSVSELSFVRLINPPFPRNR